MRLPKIDIDGASAAWLLPFAKRQLERFRKLFPFGVRRFHLPRGREITIWWGGFRDRIRITSAVTGILGLGRAVLQSFLGPVNVSVPHGVLGISAAPSGEIPDMVFTHTDDDSMFPENMTERLNLVRFLVERGHHTEALLVVHTLSMGFSESFEVPVSLASYVSNTPPDLTAVPSMSAASSVVIGDDGELYALWVRPPISLSGANPFWGESQFEDGYVVLHAGIAPFVVGVRRLVPSLSPGFLDGSVRGKLMDMRPFVVGNAGFAELGVGAIAINDGSGNILQWMGGVSRQEFVDANNAIFKEEACGVYALPNGPVLYGVKVTTTAAVPVIPTFGSFSWSGIEDATWCARLTVQDENTLRIAETFPVQTHEDRTFDQFNQAFNPSNFSSLTYGAVSADWLNLTGRVAITAKQDAAVVFQFPDESGETTRTLDHPQIGTLMTQVETGFGGPTDSDPVKIFETMRGRITVLRFDRSSGAFTDVAYVDGIEKHRVEITGAPFTGSFSGGYASFPSFSVGDGGQRTLLNNTPTWELHGPSSDSRDPGGGFTITEVHRQAFKRLFRVPSPVFAQITGSQAPWGTDLLFADLPPSSNFEDAPLWYVVSLLTAIEGEEGFILIHAASALSFNLTASIHGPRNRNAPPASNLFSALQAGAALPSSLFVGEPVIFTTAWQVKYTQLVNLSGTNWQPRRSLREQLIAQLSDISDQYDAARPGLIAALGANDAGAFANLWNPIRDALRALYGQYHTVVENTVGDDSIINLLYGDDFVTQTFASSEIPVINNYVFFHPDLDPLADPEPLA
jgi:hypothetical protein